MAWVGRRPSRRECGSNRWPWRAHSRSPGRSQRAGAQGLSLSEDGAEGAGPPKSSSIGPGAGCHPRCPIDLTLPESRTFEGKRVWGLDVFCERSTGVLAAHRKHFVTLPFGSAARATQAHRMRSIPAWPARQSSLGTMKMGVADARHPRCIGSSHRQPRRASEKIQTLGYGAQHKVVAAANFAVLP